MEQLNELVVAVGAISATIGGTIGAILRGTNKPIDDERFNKNFKEIFNRLAELEKGNATIHTDIGWIKSAILEVKVATKRDA